MKKLMALLLSLVTVLSMTCVAFAGEMPTTSNTYPAEYEYFDDGSYIVTTITESSSAFARASRSKTGSKTARYCSNSGSTLWSVTVTGSFSYTGSSATCTNSSVSASSSSSAWKISKKSASKSGSTAKATATAVKYNANGTASQTATKTVTLTCSKTGILS